MLLCLLLCQLSCLPVFKAVNEGYPAPALHLVRVDGVHASVVPCFITLLDDGGG